jgi:hypothetical protein
MTSLFSKKTFATAAVALATLGVASTLTTTAAEAGPWHRHNYGWGIAAGALGGIALGAALASRPAYAAAPVYDDEPEPRRVCSLVQRVNAYGDVIGQRRVCRIVY